MRCFIYINIATIHLPIRNIFTPFILYSLYEFLLKETIMESMPMFKSVEYVSIIDLIDSTIAWYLQLIGKLTL